MLCLVKFVYERCKDIEEGLYMSNGCGLLSWTDFLFY